MRLVNKSGFLWTVQGLLAVVFLFAGGSKLVMPAELLKGPVPLPIGLIRFVGVAEILGALGLILPGLLRVRTMLTPLAATGLVLIMTGATVITLEGGDVLPALIPFVVGLLAALVAHGRAIWATAVVSEGSSRGVSHYRLTTPARAGHR